MRVFLPPAGRRAALAERVRDPLLEAAAVPETKKPPRLSPEPLRLLALLQREGRLLDFLLEDIQGGEPTNKSGLAFASTHRRVADGAEGASRFGAGAAAQRGRECGSAAEVPDLVGYSLSDWQRHRPTAFPRHLAASRPQRVKDYTLPTTPERDRIRFVLALAGGSGIALTIDSLFQKGGETPPLTGVFVGRGRGLPPIYARAKNLAHFLSFAAKCERELGHLGTNDSLTVTLAGIAAKIALVILLGRGETSRRAPPA